METKTVTVPLENLKHLKMHWARKLLPKPRPERVNAISDDIARNVKLPPGYLIEPNLLVAGETRRLGHIAQQRGMDFIVITEEEAVNVALGENNNRQGYQFRYQTAWVYCALALRVIEESKKRQAANLKHIESPATGLSTGLPTTVAEVADLIQVSRSLLCDVVKVYQQILDWDAKNEPKRWGDDPKPRTLLEFSNARVLDEDNPCSPGQVWAGKGGKDAAAEGKTNPKPKQLDLFIDGCKALKKWGNSFPKFCADAREEAVDGVKEMVCAWPKELRLEISRELKRLEREEKEQETK